MFYPPLFKANTKIMMMILGELDRARAAGLLSSMKQCLEDGHEDAPLVEAVRHGCNQHTLYLAIWALGVAIDDIKACQAFEENLKRP